MADNIIVMEVCTMMYYVGHCFETLKICHPMVLTKVLRD